MGTLRHFLRLTFEERKIIEGFSKDYNLSQRAIALKINKSQCTVGREFRVCGGRGNYDAKKAQDISNKKEIFKVYESSKVYSKIHEKLKNLEDKIEIIQMQLEILSEQLKKRDK